MTASAVICEMIEAWAGLGGGWVRLEDIAQRANLAGSQIREAVMELVATDLEVQLEPQPFGHRITGWDKANAPVVGGEPVHLIRWGA